MPESQTRMSVRFRPATAADRSRLAPLINAAFAVETFLEGTRTDDERLAATMHKGSILLAEDAGGQLLGCVSMEVRGERAVWRQKKLRKMVTLANFCAMRTSSAKKRKS